MNIEAIRERIERGQYLVKNHAVLHALKQGFEREHMEKAICTGRIIESYPDEKRCLVCGQIVLDGMHLYLHVVCEYVDPVYIELVTAYIPDDDLLEDPPYRRSRRKR